MTVISTGTGHLSNVNSDTDNWSPLTDHCYTETDNMSYMDNLEPLQDASGDSHRSMDRHTEQQRDHNATVPCVSGESRKSSKSSRSGGVAHPKAMSSMAQLEARIQAARARAEYMSRETDIRKQRALIDEQVQRSTAAAARRKAELDADLELLQQQKEVAIAEAEMNSLRSAASGSGGSRRGAVPIPVPMESPMERTRQYVYQQASPYNMKKYLPDINMDNRKDFDGGFGLNSSPQEPLYTQYEGIQLNPDTPSFVPRGNMGGLRMVRTGNNVASELTQFLLKRELLLTRLVTFSDKPEDYAIWKSGFLNIIRELQVAPREETDLLVKWLGPESTKYASSLRASNVHNPEKGLQRIWNRLDERYGSPEMIEAALKTKLNDFPKLTNRDNKTHKP